MRFAGFLAVVVFLTVPLLALGVATLAPVGAKANLVGFVSWCPFAPLSTVMLAGLAWLTWRKARKLREPPVETDTDGELNPWS